MYSVMLIRSLWTLKKHFRVEQGLLSNHWSRLPHFSSEIAVFLGIIEMFSEPTTADTFTFAEPMKDQKLNQEQFFLYIFLLEICLI